MLTRKTKKIGSGLPGVRLLLDLRWIGGGVAPGDQGGGDGEVYRALLSLLSGRSGAASSAAVASSSSSSSSSSRQRIKNRI